MNKLIIKILFILCFAVQIAIAADNAGVATTQQQQSEMTPEQALQQLELGNQRFLANKGKHHNLTAVTAATAKSQHPIAIVLSCIDSRSAPELLFDQGIGNIFVARVAGNVVDKKALAGMEFATKITGAKLIVVMGHTNCGAIKGACSNVQLNHLTYLLQAIKPAVDQVKQSEKNSFNCNNNLTIDAIAKQNVLDQIALIPKESPVIAALVQQKKVMIVGAMQDLATGKVSFFDAMGNNM